MPIKARVLTKQSIAISMDGKGAPGGTARQEIRSAWHQIVRMRPRPIGFHVIVCHEWPAARCAKNVDRKERRELLGLQCFHCHPPLSGKFARRGALARGV